MEIESFLFNPNKMLLSREKGADESLYFFFTEMNR